MLRRSLPSDSRWTSAPHVRSLRSHSSPAQVAEALRAACEVPHPAVQVDAAVYTDAANVPALYADLDYGALLVVDVERLALALRRLRAHREHANVKQLAFLAGSSRFSPAARVSRRQLAPSAGTAVRDDRTRIARGLRGHDGGDRSLAARRATRWVAASRQT